MFIKTTKHFISAILFISVCCCTVVAGTISVEPSFTSVTLGNPVSVNLDVSGVLDLYAFQFDVGFDPAVLSAVSVSEGSLFSSVGVFFSPGFIDNGGGSITFIGDTLSGPGPGLSTDGTLAQIVFNAVGSGSSSVDLSNIILLDSSLSEINVVASPATITVTGTSAVPEPTTGASMIFEMGVIVIGAAIKRQRGLRWFQTGIL